jgi:enamine deaminase RidA (YjgF/YER057c/UK114 family)
MRRLNLKECTMLGRVGAVALLTVALSSPLQAQQGAPRYVNPPGLVRPNGYTHVVVAADGRTAYVAGQVAFDSAGAVVGAGDFRAQAERVYANLRVALASVGASFGDVVKTTTYVTDVKNVVPLREVRTGYLDSAHPPANTLLVVAGLARPELLLEIEAVAQLRPPEGR